MRRRCRRRSGQRRTCEVIEAEADDLVIENGRVCGVKFADGREIATGAVVLTTGTFLRGLIHIGEKQIPAGRVGEAPALGFQARWKISASRSAA